MSDLKIVNAPYPTPEPDDLTKRDTIEHMIASLNPHDGQDHQIAAMLRALLAENERLRNTLSDIAHGRGVSGWSARDDLQWAMKAAGEAIASDDQNDYRAELPPTKEMEE